MGSSATASRLAKVALAIALAVGATLAICDREQAPVVAAEVVSPPQDAQRRTSSPAVEPAEPESAPRLDDGVVPRESAPAELRRARDRARRDDLRRRILEQQAARDRDAASRPSGAGGDEAVDSPPLTDRIGGRDDLARLLHSDFMPLADECVTEALQRRPGLAGMLAIEFDVLADPDVGAVIDTIEVPLANAAASDGQAWDPELAECIRESAYSLSFPPPPEGGRDQFMVSLRIGDDARVPP